MSKFVDKLNKLSRISVAPIGFRAAKGKQAGSPMLIVADLTGMDIGSIGSITGGDVDAGLIWEQGLKVRNLQRIIKAMNGIPLGMVIKEATKERISKIASLGCDFVVFDMKASAEALEGEGVGKFLMVEPSLDLGLVRAINVLDTDGIFINKSEMSFITVEHLLVCRRFSDMLNKPLIINLPSLISEAELGNLWKVGVDGVVIPPAQTMEAFARLKGMIDNLPRGVKRKRGSVVDVALPYYTGDIEVVEEEEGEEE